MFEICETILLLDGCSGVGPVDLSKKVIEMGWKQDEKWDEGGRSDTCKARDRFHAIQESSNILFYPRWNNLYRMVYPRYCKKQFF